MSGLAPNHFLEIIAEIYKLSFFSGLFQAPLDQQPAHAVTGGGVAPELFILIMPFAPQSA